jgi:hypothetical protein
MKPLPLTPAEALAAAQGTLHEIVREMVPQPNTLLKDHLLTWKHEEAGFELRGNVVGLPDALMAQWICPLGKPGDVFWCQEECGESISPQGHRVLVYLADKHARILLCDHGGEGDPVGIGAVASWWGEATIIKWRTKSMPEWASRFTATNKTTTVKLIDGRWCWVSGVEVKG